VIKAETKKINKNIHLDNGKLKMHILKAPLQLVLDPYKDGRDPQDIICISMLVVSILFILIQGLWYFTIFRTAPFTLFLGYGNLL